MIRYGVPVSFVGTSPVMGLRLYESFEEAASAIIKRDDLLGGDVIYELKIVGRVERACNVKRVSE